MGRVLHAVKPAAGRHPHDPPPIQDNTMKIALCVLGIVLLAVGLIVALLFDHVRRNADPTKDARVFGFKVYPK